VRYKVIVADAPWSFSDKLRMSDVKRGAVANYATLTVKELSELPVADVAEDDAVLALWVPSSLLTEGLAVLKAWRFVHKQVFTHVKTTKDGKGLAFGMGRHFRGCTEHALIGIRGRPIPLSRCERNVTLEPGLPHSSKPETLQTRLEKMYAGAKLELFARRQREGWTCVGLEAPETLGVDIRDWLREEIAR
jgi:N6-adenosine-specific RNA methylase IME4